MIKNNLLREFKGWNSWVLTATLATPRANHPRQWI
jgi:hypothetical protein